jgi:hypothetical protein
LDLGSRILKSRFLIHIPKSAIRDRSTPGTT